MHTYTNTHIGYIVNFLQHLLFLTGILLTSSDILRSLSIFPYNINNKLDIILWWCQCVITLINRFFIQSSKSKFNDLFEGKKITKLYSSLKTFFPSVSCVLTLEKKHYSIAMWLKLWTSIPWTISTCLNIEVK